VRPLTRTHPAGAAAAAAAATEKLQAAYGGEYRNLVRFDGDHNHPRPQFFYDSVTIFFHQQLQLEKVLVGKRPVGSRRGLGGLMGVPVWLLSACVFCAVHCTSSNHGSKRGAGRTAA
jgi:hypothetical protein